MSVLRVSTSRLGGSRRLRAVINYGILLVIMMGSLEVACRLFWMTQGTGFWAAHRNLHLKFYHELRDTRVLIEGACNNCFDILFLGGSALTRNYGSIQTILTEELSRRSTRRIRVYNLAMEGHSSLDSYYKYRHLEHRHFDLVLIYEAINETRANDFPPAIFRRDYSQFPWYAMINAEERGFGHRWFVLPYTVEFVYFNAQRNYHGAMSSPKPEWVSYGCEIKTVDSFRRNVEGILQMASERQQPVLLMTYAYWIAPGYTGAKMLNRELEYTRHLHPVEAWGRPECVSAGIDAHNTATRELAASHPEVLFVDQANLMPKKGIFYNDLCHMTNRGSERFVSNILDTIQVLIPKPDRRSLAGVN